MTVLSYKREDLLYSEVLIPDNEMESLGDKCFCDFVWYGVLLINLIKNMETEKSVIQRVIEGVVAEVGSFTLSPTTVSFAPPGFLCLAVMLKGKHKKKC